MTKQELIELLSNYPDNYEVYVTAPNNKDEYFVDSLTADYKKEQILQLNRL